MVFGFSVKGDPQLDLHVPPGDADFFDEKSEELLFFFGSEVVDHGGHSVRESLDAVTDLVVAAEFSALRGEVLAAGHEV